jgi:hypothetical protein
MSDNVVTFPGRTNHRATTPLTEAAAKRKMQPESRDIADVLLSVAYHVNIGDQKSARKLLSYVYAHNPVPTEFRLPSDLFDLLERTDFGEAMFPG